MATSSENTIAKAAQEVTNDEKETNGTEEVAVEPKLGFLFLLNWMMGNSSNVLIGKAPEKPTEELYQMVIDSDVQIVVRLVIVYSSLTISMVRKNFGEGLGASIKKLNGGKKNDELANKAYINMYLGDDPLDKDAKDKFGIFLISLF
ncbi:hypothetical protein CXB51_017944 [Gossypium anomalum]|uniref:Uncharacterized protein n=1 Tax=Gossypium anomalum TaxID=47600 RepID=A0A8J5YP22_9ROSI|nr:hypothetical protein CXB51_017944 [Gossypium anomalum]